MDSGLLIQLISLIILLILSAFFSSAETALTCVNTVRLRGLAESGDKRAARVEKILSNPGKMLSTILIGNNIVNISITSLATTMTIQLFGSYAVGIATGILTVLVLICGEILPKTAANLYAEKLSLSYSFWIWKLMWLLTPVIFLIDKLSGFIMRLLGLDPSGKDNSITETELKTYVDVSHEEGVIESDEHEMILNVFDLGDSLARDIMVPRIDMTMVPVDVTFRNLQAVFKETMYSRIPVYEEDTDNIIGVVTLKDFFLINKKTDFSVRSILREAYYTYETKKTDDLLSEMRESSNSIAIVLDEYGACVGLITLEDLLEEIVGEIRDEYDEEEKELIQETSPHTYRIEGSMKLDDINDAIGTSLFSEDYDSIAGLMIEQLDRLPHTGDIVTLADGTSLEAGKISKNRISYVTLTLPSDDTEAGSNGKNDTDKDHTTKDSAIKDGTVKDRTTKDRTAINDNEGENSSIKDDADLAVKPADSDAPAAVASDFMNEDSASD